MSKSKTNATPDCGCPTGDCRPSRRQFFSRGVQSFAAIGVAVQSGATARAARLKPSGWLPTGLGRDRVLLCDLAGETQAETKRLAKGAALTSLAVAEDGTIFAADGGSSSIWRISPDGEVLDRLAGGKGGRFAVPKSFFPITWADGGLVVAHPGRHRVERYDADGELLARWGKRSRGLDGFSGCCNPVSVAVTDSGEFVTAERGQPRIKLFGKDGKFRSVIAGPEAFDAEEHEQVDTDAELVTCQNGGIEVGLLGDQVVALDHTTASFRLFDLA